MLILTIFSYSFQLAGGLIMIIDSFKSITKQVEESHAGDSKVEDHILVIGSNIDEKKLKHKIKVCRIAFVFLVIGYMLAAIIDIKIKAIGVCLTTALFVGLGIFMTKHI